MAGLSGEIRVQHNFAESLAASHIQADASWWREVYEEAFPGLSAMVCVRADGWAQRGGIDRVLTLSSGRTVTVDEKVREKAWPDILWEFWSDVDRKVTGWAAKDLACDYIAYAFVPTQVCYLLPALQVRKAWQLFGAEWVRKAKTGERGFRIVDADNVRYTTRSVAVPIDVSLSAIRDSLIVHWQANTPITPTCGNRGVTEASWRPSDAR